MLLRGCLNRWIITLSCLFTIVSATSHPGPYIPEPNPFADPANDPYNPFRYIPNNTVTGVSLGLYLLTGLTLTFYAWRWGARWMTVLIVGTYTFSIGLTMRFALANDPHNETFYIIEYLFVVLSPCAFIAADYVLLSQLATWLGAGEHLVISPNRVTLVFVLSDVTTFCVQAAGGGLSTSRNLATLLKGSHVFVGGLAAQLLSFFLFTMMYLRFLYRLRKYMPHLWLSTRWYKGWRLLTNFLLVSCVGILIRSFYRTIELSEGFTGYLAIHEVYFYALDTYPLYIAITVYVILWPGWVLTEDARMKLSPDGEVRSGGVEMVAIGKDSEQEKTVSRSEHEKTPPEHEETLTGQETPPNHENVLPEKKKTPPCEA